MTYCYEIVTKPHMTLISLTSRLEESRAYIERVDLSEKPAVQKKRAWEEKWFGFISEPVFRHLMPALYNRFGRYPSLTEILSRWQKEPGLNQNIFKLICNLHIQLSDPYYRWVTGVYLPKRHEEGFSDASSRILQQQLEYNFNPKFRISTLKKLSRNILTTARDVGLLKGNRTKIITDPLVEPEFMGYLVYALKGFNCPFSRLHESPFIRSIFRQEAAFRALLNAGESRRYWEFNWEPRYFSIHCLYDNIHAWFEETFR